VTGVGVVYCWGKNARGQLGDGTTTDRGTPTAVAGGLAFRSVSAGHAHSCGLTASGAAYCWGTNGFGNLLGSGDLGGYVSTPRRVEGGVVFASLAVAGSYVCGLTASGAAYCWGSWSDADQMARSRPPSRGSAPVAVAAP
jgi:hypothetical protein